MDMSDGVTDLWGKSVNTAESLEADFEPRDKSLSLYDRTGAVQAVTSAALEEQSDLDTRSELIDRIVRLYLADAIDRSDLTDARDRYGVTSLIPPKRWTYTELVNRPQLRIEIEHAADAETGAVSVKTAPTVKEMILDLIDTDFVEVETQSSFIIKALEWRFQLNFDEIGDLALSQDIEREASSPSELPRFDEGDAMMYLIGTEARRNLVDWFCTSAESGVEYNKSMISEETDISRQAIVEHIDTLVRFGIIEEKGDTRTRYLKNDENRVCEEISELDSLLLRRYRENTGYDE